MIEVPPIILFLGAVALWVVPFWLILGAPKMIGGCGKRTKGIRKTRAQHETELEKMWRDEVNPAPPTKAERARWAEEDNQTYIENMAAYADHEARYNEFGYVDGWQDVVIDNFGNRVIIHNSEGTGTRD